MKFAILPCLLFLSIAAAGQTAQSGVSSEWDIRKLLDSLNLETQHLKPIIDQVKPEGWVAKGASSTYIAQWKTAEAELRNVLSSADALSKQPEKLTLAFDMYFRWETLHVRIGSLRDGARRYQDPTVGDLLESVFGVNAANQEKLRQYISDLASQREEEFAVVQREAQRCRVLSSQPPTRSQGKQ